MSLSVVVQVLINGVSVGLCHKRIPQVRAFCHLSYVWSELKASNKEINTIIKVGTASDV